MAPKVIHGARAQVAIVDPTTGKARVIGIWNQFSYRVDFDVQSVYILGRFTAAELTTTGVEPVVITAQGWRIIDHGPVVEGGMTAIQNLLTQEYIVLKVFDRQSGKAIATIHGCVPTGFSSGVNAKTLQESTNTYLGLLMDDETVQNNEAASASNLP